MKQYIRPLLTAFFGGSMLVAATGCSDDQPDPTKVTGKRTVLVYAVAANNLSSYCEADKREMIRAAGNIDMTSMRLLVYQSHLRQDPELLELVSAPDGGYEFTKVKDYDRLTFSTDPSRISEVIRDVRTLRPSEDYGLVLWSHGTGWGESETVHQIKNNHLPQPNFSSTDSSIAPDANYSFGMENIDGVTDYINIDELAAAIPEGMFDFIWFDACYMAGVETICELAPKCDWFVGYPTEIMADGMPYDITLPYILRDTPDLKGAAKALFEHYDGMGDPVTVTVVDCSGIDRLAEATSSIYWAVPESPAASNVHLLSRRLKAAMYDFGQFTSRRDFTGNEQLLANFREAMENTVVYAACSDVDFSRRRFDIENHSGLNCRYFSLPSDIADPFYRNLRWWRLVNPQNWITQKKSPSEVRRNPLRL